MLLVCVCVSVAACAEQGPTFCGKILWPSQREEYLPFPEGMELTYSTESAIAKAIRESGPYTIQFSYEDMSVAYRLMEGAVARIIAEGKNHVCLQAGLLEAPEKGSPVEVSPMAQDGGDVVIDCPDCQQD